MTAMKWWGWGHEHVSFTHEDKPELAPFIRKWLDVDIERPTTRPMPFEDVEVAEPNLPDDLRAELEEAVGEVSTEPLDRVVHARGKCLRDLVRHRSGDVGRVPDAVVRPGSEPEVEALVGAALKFDCVLIPFGGGTNISGSLEPPEDDGRPVVSVDMERMSRVLEIDEASGLARVQAGVLGPDLEEQLGARGWTAGHFPDSFAHSTLGGWIATRSSGMQSDKYGDIVDLTRAVRVATPAGLLVTRPVPAASTGPDVRQMVLGSEGRLGIITEATIHVHRTPAQRVILGYLFPDWPRALSAMREIAAGDTAPSVTRVSDAPETKFSFATKKTPTALDRAKSKALMTFLERRKGIDLDQLCLSFIGFEGSERHVKRQRRLVGKVVARHGGLCIGRSPGELYDQKKFDTPYIRDYLLDRGALADVSETSAPWSLLPTVYDEVIGRGPRSVRTAGRQRLHHVPPLAQLPRRRVPVLHVRDQALGPSRAAGRVRRRQDGDPAGVHRRRCDPVPPPRGRHRARPLARGGHLRRRGGDGARAAGGRRSRCEPQPREDRRRTGARPRAPLSSAE